MEIILLILVIYLAAKFLSSRFGGAVIVSAIITWFVSLFGVDDSTLKGVFGITLFLVYLSVMFGEKNEAKK